MCEKFHFENDYKLKMIETFAADHLVKHQVAYLNCKTDAESLRGSVEDKDRHYLACHDKWTKNLRENVSQELEARARQML
jgi:hypothetical protein